MANSEPEPRKLIRFGNSSYIVSLPKDWINKHKLKKGDLIYLSENSDNEIVITSKKQSSEKEFTSIKIDVDGKDIGELKRELTSAYVSSYDEIILEGKTLNEKYNKIIYENIGVEVFEQTPIKRILKDILDTDAISIEKIIRRMDNIVRSMFEDLRTGLQQEVFKEWHYKEIRRADEEVNKLYFLLLKIARKGLQDSKAAQQLKSNSKDLADIQLIILHLEMIGDELKRIARILSTNRLNTGERKDLLDIINTIEKNYNETFTAYYTLDKNAAGKVAESKEHQFRLCEKYSENNKNSSLVAEKIRGIVASVHNLAKIVAY